MISRTLLTAVAAASLAAAARGQAQDRRADDPAPGSVVVALVSSLPDTGARAVVLRRGGSAPQDLILLRETDATAEDLAGAIVVLLRSRARHGESLTHTLRLRVQSSRLTGDPAPEAERSLIAALERIRRLPVQNLAGAGPARSATVQLGRLIARRS